MILADTDVLVDYLAGVEPVASQVRACVDADNLLTSAVTCFELLSGAQDNKRGDATRRLVAALRVVPLDREAATKAAAIRREQAGKGDSIPMADSLIAGIAIVNDLELLTRNRRHFESVSGLVLARFKV